MPLFSSPSHQFASTNPEPFSATDTTKYRLVEIIARPGNTATFQVGGPQITNTVGGEQLSPSGTKALWINMGAPFTLRDIFVAGAVGEFADSICFPWIEE